MKQKGEVNIVFPKRRPRTILGLQRWHQQLLRDCVFFEFKKKALQGALDAISKESAQYAAHVRQRAGLEDVARTALAQLNRVKTELAGELAVLKKAVRMIHDTNEMIIGTLVRTHGGADILGTLRAKPTLRSTNLLHGDGWLLEVLAASSLNEQGKAAFVTFGTMFDPAQIDIVAVDKPQRRIRWNIKWPKPRKSDTAASVV